MKNLKIKNIYLVPHSHWDREWYFSYDTANTLLHSNFVNFSNDQNKKWFLDGQWSLVDDIIKWNSDAKKLISDSIKKQNISVGPLFSQPDVFNSLGETIFRNFEVGNIMAKEFNVSQLKTAYLPDTFGFSENIPQIMKKANIKNFVFWRGLSQKQLNKNDFFNWEGIDGSTIKSFVFRNGYYSLGSFFPYNKGSIYAQKNDPNYFLGKVNDVIKKIKGNHQDLILPLGGDQAPFMHYQDEFIEKLNKNSDKYNFILVSNYDNFLKNKKVSNNFKGNLRTPITGKVHRTISSSRYDIKKAFRNAEDSLYHLLEPLEVYYQTIDKDYNFEKYKIENIFKPLLIAQSHDSLGGCNTDSTNNFQLNRIKRVQENIDSQVDLMMKKILQTNNVKDETISIFNPAPFKNNLCKVMTIYSDKIKELNITSRNLIIRSLETKNISLNTKKPLYKNKIAIYAKNLEPLTIKNFDVSKTTKEIKPKKYKIKHNSDKLIINLGTEKINLFLELIEDKGDSYDFSPGKIIKPNVKWEKAIEYSMDNMKFIEASGKINNSKFIFYAFINDNSVKTKILINNKLKNIRVSLIIEQEKLKPQIQKSLNFAMTNFIDNDFWENWNTSFKEYPAHVDVNDGIITINKNINIFTKGNNEIYKTEKGVKLVLYRTYQYVTGKNLKWRPSTSGLGWFEDSPDSQLQKTLEFDLEFSIGKVVERYNKFKFEPYLYKMQQRNFIANKMTKFAINNVLNKINKNLNISLSNKKIFISSLRKINGKIIMRLVNMFSGKEKLTIKVNNKIKNLEFKNYEIKEIKF